LNVSPPVLKNTDTRRLGYSADLQDTLFRGHTI